MNRAEAMRMAIEHVDKMATNVPMKANGYAVDGWKAPTFGERMKAVLEMAEFLWEPDDIREADPESPTAEWSE